MLEILKLTVDGGKDLKVYKGSGCNECHGTGYLGRTGIFEVMPISAIIEKMILQAASSADIRAQAVKDGMLTLRDAAMGKMIEGIIPLDQVIAQSMAND